MTPARRRLAFAAIVLAAHVLLGALPTVLEIFGVPKSQVWFRDTYAMLAASDSAKAGYNPFVENPYDLIHERHIYPDWWYALGALGLDRSDYVALGLGGVAAFWLAVLVVLPFRTRGQFWFAVAFCLSPPFWLAVNRGNPDLLVFAIMTPAVFLLHARPAWLRQLAPLPLVLATGLKYFPVLGGIILVEPVATRRERLGRIAVAVAGAALLAWSLADDVRNYLAVDWVARGQYTFGAGAIPMKFGVGADLALGLGRIAGAALVAWGIGRPAATGELVTAPPPRLRSFLLMGVAVTAGNFFLTVGYLYKIVFAVWLLPEVFRWREAGGEPARLARFALGCLIAAVWFMPLVCVTSYEWIGWFGPAHEATIRRLAAAFADLLAWGAMVPLVMIFGAHLAALRRRGSGKEAAHAG